ncbi:MAG: phage integrase N-terminal SAM-like domain-containing protein [Isosphaeraceae bacterium]
MPHVEAAGSDPSSAEPPRLLDRLRAAIRVRCYSQCIEEAYVGWVLRNLLFLGKRHPLEMGAGEINTFLTDFAVNEQVTAIFDRACESDFTGIEFDRSEEIENDHGRHEEQYVTVVYAPESFAGGVAGRVGGGSGQPGA